MKKIIALTLTLLMLLGLTACGQTDNNSSVQADNTSSTEEVKLVETNVYVLSGPTGIGAANLKDKADKGQTEGKYNITVVAQPDEVVAKISNKEADIAAIATKTPQAAPKNT